MAGPRRARASRSRLRIARDSAAVWRRASPRRAPTAARARCWSSSSDGGPRRPLFLFRRSAPARAVRRRRRARRRLPAVTIAVPLTAYAVGRYDGRWPRAHRRCRGRARSPCPAVGPGRARRMDRRAIGDRRAAGRLPGALGAWARTRAAAGRRAQRTGRAGRERARAAGPRRRPHRADPHRARDARRRRPPGEPHGAAGRRDRDGRRGPPTASSSSPGRCRPPAGRRWTSCGRWSGCSAPATSTRTPRSARSPGLEDLPRLVEQSRGRPG